MSARPILRTAGWPGVLNLETKNIGLAGGLSLRQLRGLIAAGWEIGAHSRTHPDLTTLDDRSLRSEVAGSRRDLERLLGVKVATFCYPAGRNDARVRATVRAAGYSAATTVDPGVAAPDGDRFVLPRIRVDGSDGPQAVLARVRGASTGGRATSGPPS